MRVFRLCLIAVGMISTSAASAQTLNYDRLAEKPFSIARSHHLVALVETTDNQKLIAGLDFWQKHGRVWEKDLIEEWEDLGSDERGDPGEHFGRLALAIREASKNHDPDVAEKALRTQAALAPKPEKSCHFLMSFISTGRYSPSLEKAMCLGVPGRKDPQQIRILERLLYDKEPHVVYGAINGLHWIGLLKDHQPYLRKLLDSPNELFRAMAAWHIKPASEEDAIKILGPIIVDPNPDVAEAAMGCFERLPLDFEGMFKNRRRYPASIRKALAHQLSGEKLDPRLYGLLEDHSVEVRREALRSLERHTDSVAIPEPTLRRLLYDADPVLRAAGLRGLAKLKPRDQVELVAAGLKDSTREVRRAAASAASDIVEVNLIGEVFEALEQGCGGSGGGGALLSRPENFHLVTTFMKSNSGDSRAAASYALRVGEVNPRNLALLLSMQDDPDQNALLHVAYGLGRYKEDPSAVRGLARIARRADGYASHEAMMMLWSSNSAEAESALQAVATGPNRSLRNSARALLKMRADRNGLDTVSTPGRELGQ